jgi:hypothetical protein
MSEKSFPKGVAPAPYSVYPTWAPAAKDAVGAALGTSRVWFTVAQGIITEVYYPRLDIPQLKDLGFIIANGTGFWIELRRLDDYKVTWQDDVIPAITITHHHARFMLTLKICIDPDRDVLLVDFMLKGMQICNSMYWQHPELAKMQSIIRHGRTSGQATSCCGLNRGRSGWLWQLSIARAAQRCYSVQ